MLQVDFSSDSVETQGTNISQVNITKVTMGRKFLRVISDALFLQVVFYGLHIVSPLISLELLKYPKLCHDVSLLHEDFCHLSLYQY